MKLYEYAIIWNPTDEQKKDGKKSKILVKPEHILAKDDNAAFMIAVRAIPENHTDDMDQIDVAVRPF
jgi:hypothetical protein